MAVWHIILVAVWCAVAAGTDDNYWSCGRTPIQPKLSNDAVPLIIGGVEAKRASWPWQVQLKYNGEHFCGGTLITDRWLITAAHCICRSGCSWAVPLSNITAHLGSFSKYKVDKEEQIYQVVERRLHPNYNDSTLSSDIALLLLDRAVQRTDHVRPACLPRTWEPPLRDTICYVTGFGETNGTGHPCTLKQAAVPVVDKETCRLEHTYSIHSSMLCAGYVNTGGHGPCHGDSGGPLVCQDHGNGRWYVYGVVSWGVGPCALPPYPVAVYADVAYHAHWIRQQMALGSRKPIFQ